MALNTLTVSIEPTALLHLVTSTSESSDGTTYTVTLTDGIPGLPVEG